MKTIIYRGVRYEVDDWARFITTDKSGGVWEYEILPRQLRNCFLSIVGRESKVGFILGGCPDWEKSLQRVEDCLAPEELTKTAQSETDIAKLRRFVRTILYGDDSHGGAITEACYWGFDTLQEFAVELGIVEETKPTEPCGEGCFCAANYDDWDDVVCYRATSVLTGGSDD